MTNTTALELIPVDALYLDPNNYRLHDSASYRQISPERFREDGVQSAALKRLEAAGIQELKDSIVSNGYLDIERVIVKPFEDDADKYLVIEGNRRVASLKKIKEDQQSGLDVPRSVIETLEGVPCFVVQSSDDIDLFQKVLMGIRHVGGIKEWGGYQRAKLIADLVDNHSLTQNDIALRLGITTHEATRRYRAFRALQQMVEDDQYGDRAKTALYPIFHEAVALPLVRSWLGWDESSYKFLNDESREAFYQLIVPRHEPSEENQDDIEELPPKISTYSDVRKLRDVLPNAAAKASLLNLSEDFSEAVAIINSEKIAGRWRSEVDEAQRALDSLPRKIMRSMSADDIAAIESLRDTAIESLGDIASLSAK